MSIETELYEASKARRARLWFSAKPQSTQDAIVAPKAVEEKPVAPAQPELPHYAPFNFLKEPGALAIVKLVALKHGLTPDDLTKHKGHFRHIVAARHEAIWLIKWHRPWMSLVEIGRVFGMDHTSILHAIRKQIYAQRANRIEKKRKSGEQVSQEPVSRGSYPQQSTSFVDVPRYGYSMEDRHSNSEAVA